MKWTLIFLVSLIILCVDSQSTRVTFNNIRRLASVKTPVENQFNYYSSRGGAVPNNDKNDVSRSKSSKRKIKKDKERKVMSMDSIKSLVLDDDNDVSWLNENPVFSSILNIFSLWNNAPPISKCYVGASVGLTTLLMIINGNEWPEILILNWPKILTKFQIWRIFASFLYFGPMGLNYILTLQFVWQFFPQLEKIYYKEPEVFCTMLLYGAISFIALFTFLGVSPYLLGHNFTTFIVYIWSRFFAGTEVGFLNVLSFNADLLPWFFCAQSLLIDKQFPVADLLGILVGHFVLYLQTKKLLFIPAFVKDFFTQEKIKNIYSKYNEEL